MAAPVSSWPRVRVAALIALDGRVVTVRHRAGQARYHLLPGGGVDYREPLATALQREVLEETGLTIEVGRPLLLSDTIDPAGPRHVINILFAAVVTGGAITSEPSDPRVECVDLFTPEELNSIDLRPDWASSIESILNLGDDYVAEYLGSLFKANR